MLRPILSVNRRIGVLALGAATSSAVGWYFYTSSTRRGRNHLTFSPYHFTRALVVGSEDAGLDAKLITLKLPEQTLTNQSTLQPIWSVFIKDHDIQVERPYTPLEGVYGGELKFWIKKYDHGEVGKWILSQPIGGSIEIRGPVTTLSSEKLGTHWKRIIMISGGTGITPFYQLLYNLFSANDPSTQNSTFTLLHSSRSLEALPQLLLFNITQWADHIPSKLRVQMFVDQLNRKVSEFPVREGRIIAKDLKAELQNVEIRDVLFLVCGPDEMISAIAGPRSRDGSQGNVGGILGQMGCKPDQVWKL